VEVIQAVINVIVTDNKRKRLSLNDIMKALDTYYMSNDLEKYKPLTHEYVYQKNYEEEVIHIYFVLNHAFLHIINL